ncbi:MAG: shikimate kinase [Desulfobacterales bacterium]|nr:shikimate kinase [Desulfobacterales bacterium]
MNIYLIGYRCSGKTSVGSYIASIMGTPFIDADQELVKDAGMPISKIVDDKGWDFFRELEKQTIKKISGFSQKHVVATGGGVILKAENIEVMKKSGVVIWLKVNSETIKKRMFLDETTKEFRPSLTSKSLDKEIEDTLLERIPLYEKAKDFSIETDNISIEDTAALIKDYLIRTKN